MKGSFLLGRSAPFAIYASEALAGWLRGGRWRARALGGALGVLCGASALTFSYHGVFRKAEFPGTEWRSARP